MGELPPIQSLLSHYRPLHGPEGWTNAHQAAGGPVRRAAGRSPSELGFYFETSAETEIDVSSNSTLVSNHSQV